MTALLDATLKHLKALVSFDTRNPPRKIGTGGIFDYVREQLPDFNIEVTDYGAGAVSLFAVRGKPNMVFNVHMDTVPDSPDWSQDPHTMTVNDEVAIGLGVCDIKGAAASLLAVAQAEKGDMAILLSSDEEANDARCIKGFLAQHPATGDEAFKAIIVAEPTQGRAVLAHRGIQSIVCQFFGKAGHASAKQRPADSAVHQAIAWSHDALAFAAGQQDATFSALSGLRFNIGTIKGGVKANIIAPQAELCVNMRPLPNMDPDALVAQLQNLALDSAKIEEKFRGPAMPAGDPEKAEARRQKAQALAEELEIPLGDPVDFWTEAAKFSLAGYTTFVYGPGSIAQAHTADEWVALSELDSHVHCIANVVAKGQA